MSADGNRSGVFESDRARFEELYATCFDAVAGYLLARTDRESASEALARTFEIAWRRFADVPADPLPWLLGVARRVLSEQRRAAGRREALIARIAQTTVETTEDHAVVLSERDRLLNALGELPVAQCEALLLVAWDGLSQRDAATVLGCSRAALAVRVHRARRRLRTALENQAPAVPAGPHDQNRPAADPVKPSTEEAL